jgi:hypothetical protein
MESEEREQDLQEAHDDAVAEADRMEEQTAELGESIDAVREARDNAASEMEIAGTGGPQSDDEMDEDPPAPAQEPPGDED